MRIRQLRLLLLTTRANSSSLKGNIVWLRWCSGEIVFGEEVERADWKGSVG